MTNEATAIRMKRRIEKWDVPKKIKFGNGTTNIATHYADFGRTLGRLTIVEGADMTLISIWDIASGGNGIYFDVDNVGRDQVEDYAKRKGWTIEQAEKWLRPVLGYKT
jgi:hypothetical protein